MRYAFFLEKLAKLPRKTGKSFVFERYIFALHFFALHFCVTFLRHFFARFSLRLRPSTLSAVGSKVVAV